MIEQSEQLKVLSLALKEIADNVMITSRSGVIEYVNPAFEDTTGYHHHEVIGLTPKILRSGEHNDAYYQKLWKTILAGGVFRATTVNRKKNGDIYYADQTISSVTDEDGEIIHFVSVWKDVTENIENEKKLRLLNEELRLEKHKLEEILKIESGMHLISNLNKLFDFAVAKTCEVLEAQRCSLLLIDQETRELCVKGHIGIEATILGERPLKVGDDLTELINRHGHTQLPAVSEKIDGTVYRSESFLSVPIKVKDELLGIINVSAKKSQEGNTFTELDLKILQMIVRQVKIVIENAKLYGELKFLTITDPITGIHNHRYLTQTLDYEIQRIKRYGRDLSFLMIDIDGFKSYNDSLGHLEGDNLLKNMAQTIKSSLRMTDFVCRYAGDEFAVILPETNLEQAKIVAEKIRQNTLTMAAKKPVTVSIGVAQCQPGNSRHDLVQKADSHLYTAKRQGKNKISG